MKITKIMSKYPKRISKLPKPMSILPKKIICIYFQYIIPLYTTALNHELYTILFRHCSSLLSDTYRSLAASPRRSGVCSSRETATLHIEHSIRGIIIIITRRSRRSRRRRRRRQGDRDDVQEITAFFKYIIFIRKSLSNKYF